MKHFILAMTLLFIGTPNASDQQDKSDPSKTFAESLAASKSLKTFSKAMKLNAFELEFLKSGDVPFTIFAPSDSALAKIDKEAKSDKEKIENTFLNRNEQCTLLHVFLGQKLTSKDLMAMAKNGKPLNNEWQFIERNLLSEKGGSVFIDGVKVTQPDILCKGGVIHVIDGAIKRTR
ncbi:MAG: fasciclin domain-containing protein [Fuerstiella sp.]|jgi:uncharacterized surface protein with fasciclin (FAS1) repeats|nr:fasciclin domain-containing protein [Fuerstiella sp.]